MHSGEYSMTSWLKRVFQVSLKHTQFEMSFYGPELEIITHMSYLLVCYVYWKICSKSQPVECPKNIHDITGPVFYSISRHQLHICSAKMTLCIFSTKMHDLYRPTIHSYINVQSCEFEWGHLQLWIYSVVLCQLGNTSQWTERVWKFLPEVMAMIYACNGWGDVMSSYVLVKQQAVGKTLWKMLHEHTRWVKHHRTTQHWIIF